MNPNGILATFGPGDAVRRWNHDVGVAHDFLVGVGDQAFHSPGPGNVFQMATVADVLANARWVEVVDAAPSPQAAWARIKTAIGLIGTPWTFGDANCQDTISYIVNGKPNSFQREGLIGLGVVVLFGIALLSRPQHLNRKQ